MRAIALFSSVALVWGGCRSFTKYQTAGEKACPVVLLNVPFPPGPMHGTLAAVIVCGGPGSWKREALWDEYVVVLRNPGAQPVVFTGAELQEFSGTARTPGTAPWALEDASVALVREYGLAGTGFAKDTLPTVMAAGLSAGSSAYTSWASTLVWGTPDKWGVVDELGPLGLRGPVALSYGAGLALVPTFVVERILANREDRADIEAEFELRRLAFPLTLAPGQARAGSLFFPMSPNPRALILRWRRGEADDEARLTLDFLHGMHAPRMATGGMQTREVSRR